MKIKLRTAYASPKRTADAGSVIELPEDEARELVKEGYAELFGNETAARRGGVEKAVRRNPQLHEAPRNAENEST